MLNDSRTRCQELEQRNGKLERAIIRQQFEKDHLVTKNHEDNIGFDQDLRCLVREQVSHIGDLQKEVNTLQAALKDLWRSGGDVRGHRGPTIRMGLAAAALQSKRGGVSGRAERSPRRTSLDRETARLTRAAASVVGSRDANGGKVDGGQNALQRARQEIDDGARRIAQLENWLDEIYNNRELGLGPTAGRSRDQPDTGRQRSRSLAATLPELSKSVVSQVQNELQNDKPPWDYRTKLPAAVGKTTV